LSYLHDVYVFHPVLGEVKDLMVQLLKKKQQEEE
jgi:hypothetical protein